MINMTSFETLFEFLGLNFRSLECVFIYSNGGMLVTVLNLCRQSTVVNTVAYRAIALDFELWSRTRKEIQRVHLEQFTTVLNTSRHKKFNVNQRFSKMGLVRKLLFVLQTDWYLHDSIPFVVEALKMAAQAHFSKDDAIKPIVSYLAANLQEGPFMMALCRSDVRMTCLFQESGISGSPHSMLSRIDYKDPREKAEQVLEFLISTLSTPVFYTKFTATLPLTRICLLLLGDRPSPVVASQVLILLGISINASPSFSRKFELIGGWSVLKTVLPLAWDPSVNEAAFDILLGRVGGNKKSGVQEGQIVVCPHIIPAIFCALQRGVASVADNCDVSDNHDGTLG